MEELSHPETRESLRQSFEILRKEDPEIIFKGAILASGNNLKTDYEQVVELFTRMQKGRFTYPESMRQIVENVRICDHDPIYPGSKQIDWIFQGISFDLAYVMDWRDFKGRWGWYAAQYGLTEEAAASFLQEWGDDEEAMEFFARCADFLMVKERS